MLPIWIWENTAPRADEYAEFYSIFESTGKITLTVSCDSNYAAYLNGNLVAFGQYADYPHRKVADILDLPAKAGKNELRFVVWFYGNGSSCYIPGKAGLYFTVAENDKLLDASGTHTLCRTAEGYVPYRAKNITGQMGFTYWYDANRKGGEFHNAVETGYTADLTPRPNKSLELMPLVAGKVIDSEKDYVQVDLGHEEVGFLSLSLCSDEEQTLQIAYGEHLRNGHVAQCIGGRDFSVTYTAKSGENVYLNPFRRLGARYLEIRGEKPFTLHTLGLCPTLYPLMKIPFNAGSEKRQKIYDTCVRTLRLCMHEHYEDCPWREQALYCMDSRNQMLAGYYAFKEYTFPRSSLWLMAQDRRADNLLSITFPHGGDLAIPSFSLHWFTEMEEYMRYSGDTSLVRESWDKLNSVLAVFTSRIREDGLCYSFGQKCHWNFYEWSDGLSGTLGRGGAEVPDLLLNSLLVCALEKMDILAQKTGLTVTAGTDKEALRKAIHDTFMTADGLFEDFAGTGHKSELGNALAIRAGCCSAEEGKRIAERITEKDNGLVGVTLSMKCFVYDALLQIDTAKYTPWVLADIDTVWGRMIDAGATSVWETEEGAGDFSGAGSLCHGWSAMPVYYYWNLLK